METESASSQKHQQVPVPVHMTKRSRYGVHLQASCRPSVGPAGLPRRLVTRSSGRCKPSIEPSGHQLGACLHKNHYSKPTKSTAAHGRPRRGGPCPERSAIAKQPGRAASLHRQKSCFHLSVDLDDFPPIFHGAEDGEVHPLVSTHQERDLQSEGKKYSLEHAARAKRKARPPIGGIACAPRMCNRRMVSARRPIHAMLQAARTWEPPTSAQ